MSSQQSAQHGKHVIFRRLLGILFPYTWVKPRNAIVQTLEILNLLGLEQKDDYLKRTVTVIDGKMVADYRPLSLVSYSGAVSSASHLDQTQCLRYYFPSEDIQLYNFALPWLFSSIYVLNSSHVFASAIMSFTFCRSALYLQFSVIIFTLLIKVSSFSIRTLCFLFLV